MTSANIAGTSADPIGYERSRAHLAHVAEIELKRTQALAEALALILSGGLAVADIGLFYLRKAVFKREEILTKWK
jgi:hypothetical protein